MHSDESKNIHGTERNRQRFERLTPEQKEAYMRVRAENQTPEKRAEYARVRELVEQEFPPLQPGEPLLNLVASLRLERERQGLSLAEVCERTRMNVSTVNRLELGKVANPSYETLTALARALGLELEITVKRVEEHTPAR